MKRVVIVGAGYGGLKVFESLARQGDYEVILFDKHPYHYLQTEIYKFIANKNRFTDVTIDLHTFGISHHKHVIFYKEAVENINFRHKKVITAKRRIGYDYLVIATGATTNFNVPIEGLKTFSHEIKNLHGAMRFKQAFEKALLERVETEGEHSAFSIVIIGAGLSGVEIAAEMAHFARSLYAEKHFLCDRIRITLVSSSESVLPGLDPYLQEQSQKRLKQLSIDILTNRRAVKLSENRVYLDNGEIIESTFTLFAGGIMPTPLHERLAIAKDDRGFITVEPTLAIADTEGAFAIGDCASILDSDGNELPATADIAETSAAVVTQNIIRSNQNKPLKPHALHSRGIIVALGGTFSSAKIGPLRFSGKIAFIMKWLVENFYTLRLRRACKQGTQEICRHRDYNNGL